MNKELSLGIVGATGAVGGEILKLLDGDQRPIAQLNLFGSNRSAGSSLHWRSDDLKIQDISNVVQSRLDLIFFAANLAVSAEYAPILADQGVYVIDNSSAFRMEEGVPLVVPEINFDSIGANNRIIANPNCSTIIMLMAVAPLRELGTVKRIIVSTYQSASGAGREAMEELKASSRAFLDGVTFEPHILPFSYAFNLFSHNTEICDEGYNGEEMKMISESRKILGDPELLVNPTCIRVPVLRSHSESITVEFEEIAPAVEDVRNVLKAFPGVKLIDDRENNRFPMPNDSNGEHDVFVGRIRQDLSNPNAISLFVCGDQLLKGAALNAVQIGARLFGFDI